MFNKDEFEITYQQKVEGFIPIHILHTKEKIKESKSNEYYKRIR